MSLGRSKLKLRNGCSSILFRFPRSPTLSTPTARFFVNILLATRTVREKTVTLGLKQEACDPANWIQSYRRAAITTERPRVSMGASLSGDVETVGKLNLNHVTLTISYFFTRLRNPCSGPSPDQRWSPILINLQPLRTLGSHSMRFLWNSSCELCNMNGTLVSTLLRGSSSMPVMMHDDSEIHTTGDHRVLKPQS